MTTNRPNLTNHYKNIENHPLLMSRFFEPLFCCHWFMPKNKLLHNPLTP